MEVLGNVVSTRVIICLGERTLGHNHQGFVIVQRWLRKEKRHFSLISDSISIKFCDCLIILML